MSRSGYSDDIDQWQMIKWRGQVASAIRGKRGQMMLRDLLVALDEMPDKVLVVHELESEEGEVCALGALARKRQIDMSKLDPNEPEEVGAVFGIASCLAQEIVYMNDEYFDRYWDEKEKIMVNLTPGQRWHKMREWVESKIGQNGASSPPQTE